MSAPRPFRRRPVARFEVFAVEDDAIQVSWGALAPGVHPLRLHGPDVERTIEVRATGGPGTLDLPGLTPDRPYTVELAGERRVVRTLAPPPGPALFRFATISDTHIGERAFGHLPRLTHPAGPGAHPEPCLTSAVRDALAWGAQALIFKGDLTHSDRDEEYEVFARCLRDALDGADVPVLLLPGNHDGGDQVRGDGAGVLARYGFELTTGLRVLDVPGVRLVAVSSRRVHSRLGRVPSYDELAAVLREAPGPAVVATHHHPQRTFVTTHWPPGMTWFEGLRFLRTVERANGASLVTAGHTHRHRRRRAGSVVVTEVGSPKDYPGTWGGYAVHEGGIRQVVRRVSAPEALEWTEETRRTVLGSWGRWSPGSLSDRCFSHTWPASRAGTRPGA